MKKTIVLLITLALLLLCATAWAEPAAGEQPAEGFFRGPCLQRMPVRLRPP